MDKMDWLILNALSDAYESLSQILGSITQEWQMDGQMNIQELRERIVSLYEMGYVALENELTLDNESFLMEPLDVLHSPFLFGLTLLGAQYWEENLYIYTEEEIDWDWCCHLILDNVKSIGYIRGGSLQACQEYFSEIEDQYNLSIDKDSVQCKEIENFQVKYFKVLERAHEISFAFRFN